jgi:peptidoglycan/LPS O-acetylase OafA/YrhL
MCAMPRLGYRPALDGLRGLAILGVLFRHAFGIPAGGGYGVDLFFVLSGFLITTLLIEEREATGLIAFRDFFRRRALRLLPALAALLPTFLLLAAVKATIGHDPELLARAARAVAATAFYTANLAAAFHPTSIGGLPLSHLWSLAEEEQFYLLWPITLFALLRIRRGREVAIFVLVALISAVIVERFALLALGAPPARVYYGPDTHADGLLMGSLLGLLLRRPPRLSLDRALAPVALLVLAGLAYKPYMNFPFVDFAGVGLVASVVAQPNGPAARAASFRPLVEIGRISYGLYLWHPLVIWTVGSHWLGLVLSFPVALLSYRLIEQPFLRRKRLRPSATPEPVLVPT